MLCFKDRTFCPFYDKCVYNKDCERALTPEIWEQAEKAGLPISRFAIIPECFVDVEKVVDAVIASGDVV